MDSGEISSNLVEITDDLAELFDRYLQRAMPFERAGDLLMPFYHLTGDGFWHLLPRDEKDQIGQWMSSPNRLREGIIGARLNEDLYELLRVRENRERLRDVLIATYFSPEIGRFLLEQAAVNLGAFIYSDELLRNPGEPRVRETLSIEEAYRPAVRDQGFRRAVVTAYKHRCALCGIRVLTLDGHTVVTAAHIVPWSEGHDDRPTNGMALCRTCHWTFDEGLVCVSTVYEIRTSDQLTTVGNLPGYLTSLEGRGIVGPSEKVYWPDPDSLRWHHEHVFRSG